MAEDGTERSEHVQETKSNEMMNLKRPAIIVGAVVALLLSGPITHHLMGDYCLGEGCNIWIDFIQYSVFWTIVVVLILAIYALCRRLVLSRILTE
jgi:hypothetical protein